MTVPSSRAHDTMRSLLMLRNTWDPRMRGIVRELIRADIRQLRGTAGSRS